MPSRHPLTLSKSSPLGNHRMHFEPHPLVVDSAFCGWADGPALAYAAQRKFLKAPYQPRSLWDEVLHVLDRGERFRSWAEREPSLADMAKGTSGAGFDEEPPF